MSINFDNISLFVSGCIDLSANKKCTLATLTYMIAILYSGCMDLYDWHFVSGYMDLFCMCEFIAQRLDMKSKSEGIWYQQKIWETLGNWVIAVIIVIVVIPVLMGNSSNNSLFCVKIKSMQECPVWTPAPFEPTSCLFGPAPCRPHTCPIWTLCLDF